MAARAWTLRYASHLGYGQPGRALFCESAASADPVAQVDFTAAIGFAGVQFAKAVDRPKEERAQISSALQRHGLETGCIVYATREVVLQPLWGSDALIARRTWQEALENAFDVAAEINAHHVVVLSGVDPAVPLRLQHAAFVENLKRAAELARTRDIIICLENMSRKIRPSLLAHIGEAYEVVRAVDSPNVRLVFDTGHVQAMDGDVLENLRAVWDAIALIQIADNPGRLEPGTGELNFQRIIAEIYRLGYTGLVELEFNWSQATAACELRGIEYLRAIDAALTTRVE